MIDDREFNLQNRGGRHFGYHIGTGFKTQRTGRAGISGFSWGADIGADVDTSLYL